MLDLQARIDAAVEENIAPDEYFSIWEEPAKWQMDALQAIGLKPHHKLLDFGCGAMRLGLQAVPFLDDGNYYGIDAFDPYIRAARKMALQSGLSKTFHLKTSRDFGFDEFGAKFDYVIAQSVFTHLSARECDECMAKMRNVVSPGATFLFTYLIGTPHTQGMLYLGMQPMRRFDNDDPQFFANLGAKHGATFEQLEMPHITGQQVAVYRYPGVADSSR